jgi:tripartite-type tricarboxylate transporter receptor subunit TctC
VNASSKAANSILLAFISGFILRSVPAPEAQAQAWPAKPVRILVGFAPGGASDVTARLLSPKLTESLAQPFIVENRAGSGGLLATDAVAKSPPDGYTLLLMPAADTVQPAIRRKLPYDLVRDFAPVARMVYEGSVQPAGTGPRDQHAGGIRRVHPQRSGAEYQGGEGRGHQSGVIGDR